MKYQIIIDAVGGDANATSVVADAIRDAIASLNDVQSVVIEEIAIEE